MSVFHVTGTSLTNLQLLPLTANDWRIFAFHYDSSKQHTALREPVPHAGLRDFALSPPLVGPADASLFLLGLYELGASAPL